MDQINGRIHWSLHEKCIVKGIPVKQAESSDFYKRFMTFLSDIRKLEGLWTEQYYLQEKYILVIFFKWNLCMISCTNTGKCTSAYIFLSLLLNILDHPSVMPIDRSYSIWYFISASYATCENTFFFFLIAFFSLLTTKASWSISGSYLTSSQCRTQSQQQWFMELLQFVVSLGFFNAQSPYRKETYCPYCGM